MTTLEEELDYYIKHQNELVKQYEGKYLVIKNKKIVGAYDSEIEAYNDAKNKFEVGTFLIQPCMPGSESYTQTFHSRVAF